MVDELQKRRKRRRREIVPGQEIGGIYGPHVGSKDTHKIAGTNVQVSQRLDKELANKGMQVMKLITIWFPYDSLMIHHNNNNWCRTHKSELTARSTPATSLCASLRTATTISSTAHHDANPTRTISSNATIAANKYPFPSTQVKLMNELQHQLRRAKVINVPHYDADNDRFVFDDGKIIANNDPIFNRFKWAWSITITININISLASYSTIPMRGIGISGDVTGRRCRLAMNGKLCVLRLGSFIVWGFLALVLRPLCLSPIFQSQGRVWVGLFPIAARNLFECCLFPRRPW